MKVLSICIPSYNRFDILQENLDSIFLAKSTDFEVVVIDNCSKTDINIGIKCRDSRLRIIKRQTPVDFGENIVSSLILSDSVFSLLCTDKDLISGEKIDAYINVLKNNLYLMGGYCEQDLKDDIGYEIVEECAILKFGYLCRHPSGYFFRTEKAKCFYDNRRNEIIGNPFGLDLLLSWCSSFGPMMIYKNVLVFTTSLMDRDLGTSYSYSGGKGNVFFSVENRRKQFEQFVVDSVNVIGNDNLYRQLLKRLLRDVISRITYSYNDVIGNPLICKYYCVGSQKLNIKDMCVNVCSLDRVIWRKTKLSFACKLYYVIYGKVYFGYLVFRRIIGRIYRGVRGIRLS